MSVATEEARPGEEALGIESLRFAVGSQAILAALSLRVRRGELLAVVGPNGAGKSTLLRCLVRILPATSGQIRVAGESIDALSQRELARRVSYVPQAAGDVPRYRVAEFVFMGRYPHLGSLESPRAADLDAVDAALRITAMELFRDRALRTLSGGELQKVFIAAALAQESPLLLLDEPTAFLDYRHQEEIRTLLLHLNRDRGRTVVVVTHDLNLALSLDARVVALRHGEIVFDGAGDELVRGDTLESIYETAFSRLEHPVTRRPIVLPAGARDAS